MQNLQLKATNWSYLLWWWLPIILGFVIEIASGKFENYRFLNLLENHLFAVAFISLALLLKQNRIRKLVIHLLFSVFVFFIFAETLYFNWFGANFSASSIFVLFETNVAEASEFLSFYINPFSVIYALFSFAYVGLYWLVQWKKELQLKLNPNRILLLFILITNLAVLRVTKLIDQNFPYLVARGVIVYQDERDKLADLAIDEKFGEFTAVKSKSNQARTFVLIIGESTTKHNFELYRYPRKNNPLLRKEKDQLHVFEDVISTNAFTIGALKTALSLNNFDAENESTIIQLFNQAGFETHWISNQRPIGPYESIVTKISRASDFYTFTNTALAGRKTPLDEVLLPHLKSTLKRKAKDKFIVLHLLGTHLQYKDRYPKSFNKFKNRPPNLRFDHDEAIQKRNEYDNAVLYTDFLIHQVIQQVKQEEGESYVLYFSDHGEEVYKDQDFAGHNDDNPTPSMFEVPFMLWLNKDFQDNFNGVLDTKRKYSLKSFIHSLAELSSIQFEEFKPERSIFSEEFKSEPRTVKRIIDYDQFKNTFNQ